LEGYLRWVDAEKEADEKAEFDRFTPLCKFRVMKGMVFRRSNPAIFGAEVLAGRLRQKAPVVNQEGRDVGTVHGIEDKGKVLADAEAGMEVAVSMTEPMIGRQINEGEVLYTAPRDDEVKVLKEKYLNRLTPEEQEIQTTNREMAVRLTWRPYMHDPRLPALLQRVNVPSLVVWGRQDALVPLNCGELYHQSLYGSTLKVIENCGHVPQMEKPKEFADTVLEFLTRRARRRAR